MLPKAPRGNITNISCDAVYIRVCEKIKNFFYMPDSEFIVHGIVNIFVKFFRQNSRILKKFSGDEFKARGLIFWILALYICILAPVKTKFENH